MPINSKLQHPPGHTPGILLFSVPGSREFDAQGLPGGGEFDLCLRGRENEPEVSGFKLYLFCLAPNALVCSDGEI